MENMDLVASISSFPADVAKSSIFFRKVMGMIFVEKALI